MNDITIEWQGQVVEVTATLVIGGGGSSAVDSVNGETGVVVLDTSDIAETTNLNYVNDNEKIVLQNTSGENTGDQDLSGLQPLAQVLTDTTASFTTAEKEKLNKTLQEITASGIVEISVKNKNATLLKFSGDAAIVLTDLPEVGKADVITIRCDFEGVDRVVNLPTNQKSRIYGDRLGEDNSKIYKVVIEIQNTVSGVIYDIVINAENDADTILFELDAGFPVKIVDNNVGANTGVGYDYDNDEIIVAVGKSNDGTIPSEIYRYDRQTFVKLGEVTIFDDVIQGLIYFNGNYYCQKPFQINVLEGFDSNGNTVSNITLPVTPDGANVLTYFEGHIWTIFNDNLVKIDVDTLLVVETITNSSIVQVGYEGLAVNDKYIVIGTGANFRVLDWNFNVIQTNLRPDAEGLTFDAIGSLYSNRDEGFKNGVVDGNAIRKYNPTIQ